MIKRDGVAIMNARTKNVSIAKETLDILKEKHYTSLNGEVVDISKSLDAAVDGTIYYPADFDFSVKAVFRIPKIEVTNETTAQAAVRLADKENLVALNFASARNQGGGFLSGAVAQEEDLCRCSGLYSCLKKKPLFYNANILCDDTLYTDGIIYSPKVPFIRNEHNLLLETPFELSIISAPAPNLNGSNSIDEDLYVNTILNRSQRILQVAHENGHKNIILGAWGCGAFGNDSVNIANIFMAALQSVPSFEHVCFAIYDTRTPPHLFETFQEVCLVNE
jgi:uncharacterized protein (TIGR02452 family)